MFGFLGDAISGVGSFAGDVIAGGWNTITGLPEVIAGGAETTFGTIFPTAQREQIESNIYEPMYETGLDYRVTDPDAPSWQQTLNWSNQNWVGSPYESELSVPAKRDESIELAQSISASPENRTIAGMLSDVLEWTRGGIEQVREVRTVVDEFAGILGWNPRETISEGPTEIGNSPGSVAYTNQPAQGGPDIITALRGMAGGIVDQVRGLFSLGYEQTRDQGAFAIRHELDPSGKTIGLVVLVAIAIVVAIFFLRK